MKSKFENCFMILPNHQVGFGDLETEGDIISAINLKPQTYSHNSHTASRLLLPGLINCHGHTPMTLMRGLGGGLPLQRWLEEAIFPAEAKMTPKDVHAGAVWGIMEMLAGGTTCVADMYDFPGEMGSALIESGMKGRICRVGLSFVPGRLEDCIKSTQKWNEWIDREVKRDVREDICIHSEYLTDEPFCRSLAQANQELKRPLHVHISETEKEHRECLERHGKTPIAYFASTGILDQGGYAAHCVHCTDDDFKIMAEKGISLIHNPTSNMKLGSGFARILRARELGVNVALGTDGVASNDNLDMFEEMHLASLIHKGLMKDPSVLSAWDVIDMATVNGAKALRMNDTGELAVGKKADFCVINLNKPHIIPCIDIPNIIVNSMHASDVEMTIIDGEQKYAKDADDLGYDGWIAANTAKEELLAAVKRIGLKPLTE